MLPLFAPGVDPGPSFVDLLRQVAPDALPPQRRWGRARQPFEITHGTTVVAIRYADGVVMAGDRRATAGYTIANRRIEKVFPADDYSGVAIAGAAGPAVEMVQLFQVQLEHYEKVEGEQLSLEGKANQLAQMVRGQPARRDAGLRGRAALRRLRPPPPASAACSATTSPAASTRKPTTRPTAPAASTPATGSRPAGARA